MQNYCDKQRHSGNSTSAVIQTLTELLVSQIKASFIYSGIGDVRDVKRRLRKRIKSKSVNIK